AARYGEAPQTSPEALFPQEITRDLLNLISNGFYAATKRKGQSSSDTYEQTLTAATKHLGDKVEIRIRDSGTGVPPDVREKMSITSSRQNPLERALVFACPSLTTSS